MDSSQLEYFISVAQTLNFRESARRLNISQSSVSRYISDLESQLGAQLFTRSNRSVTLTPEGQAFLPYALDVVRTMQKATDLVHQVHTGTNGHISIATVSASTALLTRCLDRFSRQYPDVVVDVTLNNGSEAFLAMREDKYDFHFAPQSMLSPDTPFHYLVTHRDRLALVMPKGHPLAKMPVDFSALNDEHFLIISESSGPALYRQILATYETYNYHPRIVSHYSNAESVLLSVSAGLGISILPQVLAQNFLPGALEILPLENVDMLRPYILAWRKDMKNPSACLFLDTVKDVLEHLEPSDAETRDAE